jgi:hypothetical protein
MAKCNEGNRKPQRWSPELGRPDVNPYAMMLPNPNGGWVEYKDYLKLLEVLDDALDIIERD